MYPRADGNIRRNFLVEKDRDFVWNELIPTERFFRFIPYKKIQLDPKINTEKVGKDGVALKPYFGLKYTVTEKYGKTEIKRILQIIEFAPTHTFSLKQTRSIYSKKPLLSLAKDFSFSNWELKLNLKEENQVTKVELIINFDSSLSLTSQVPIVNFSNPADKYNFNVKYNYQTLSDTGRKRTSTNHLDKLQYKKILNTYEEKIKVMSKFFKDKRFKNHK